MKTYLGIDIGSLTIKFVLIDENANVLYWTYERTGGKPIEAIQKGLKKLKEWIENHNPKIEICGVGTTGSGRYLAGVIVGADLIKNEITAFAKGAAYFVPDVRTVIDIGGQDSKIIILENGVAVDFAMNYLCVPPETKIITEDFIPKPISEIKVGERVLTHLGRFKRVEEVFERDYEGEMIEISLSNLKTLVLTPEHPVLGLKREDIKCYYSYSRRNTPVCRQFNEKTCKKKCTKWKKFSWEPYFIPAKELREGDFVATPLPFENELDDPVAIDYSLVHPKALTSKPFKKINKFTFKPDLLRLLGYYLAEGSIILRRSKRNKEIKHTQGVIFGFNIGEENYINDVSKIISDNFNNLSVKIKKRPKTHTTTVEVYSKSLADYINYLCGSMADKKRLSRELLNLPSSLQKEILKGFFRGDGQLRMRPNNISGKEKKGNRYCGTTVSETLANQLYWLLLRNKIKCTFRRRNDKTKGGKYAYLIEIFGKEINKLIDKNLINPKKQGYKSFIYKNWFYEPIKEIKRYHFDGLVYNLNVKDDHSYVANFLTLKNCAAGTGSFLDAQAFRLGIPIERFGELALKSKSPTTIASRCTVFCESDMIHKQQIGHKIEDIVAGLCEGLVRNYLANVAKGKKISPPILFVGGVSENVGMRWAFEKALGQKVIVPKYNTVMGALGAALLVKENPPQETKFRGFEISDMDIKCDSFICKGCPNQCEVIEAKMNGKIISRWGDRCGRWSNLKYD